MGTRFSNSIELIKQSWAVLREHKQLAVFPAVSSIAAILLIGAVAVPSYWLIGADSTSGESISPWFYLVLLIFYFVMSFVVIFFNTGLIASAQECLKGGDPSVSYGFKVAVRHLGKIFQWALISAVVGYVLSLIRQRGGILGAILAGLGGIAWNLVTFFVIPVLIFQELGVIESIKESAGLFKRTWGENMIARFSMGLVFGLVGLVGIVPILLAVLTKSVAIIIGGVAVAVAFWALLAIISAGMTGILSTALYDYAVTGQVPSAYNAELITGAFQQAPAKKKGLWG